MPSSDLSEPHLSEDQLRALVAGRIRGSERLAAARHLEYCDLCLDSLNGLKSASDDMRRAERENPETMAEPGSGGRLLLMVAVVIAITLAAVAWQYLPHTRKVSATSLRDAGLSIELGPDGLVQGLNEISGLERDQVSAVLRERQLPSGPVFNAEKPAAQAVDYSGFAPVNTRVLSDRPAFSWRALPGAGAYEVTVTNQSRVTIARSGPLTVTQWQPPTALPRDEPLFWQVNATRGKDNVTVPAEPVRFVIASAETAYRIQQIHASAHPSHLLLAMIFAREGIYAEAESELKELAHENPGSTLVGSLEKSISVQHAGRQ